MRDSIKSIGSYLIIIIGTAVILNGAIESSTNMYLYVSGIMLIMYGVMIIDFHKTENYITELEMSIKDTMKQVERIQEEK